MRSQLLDPADAQRSAIDVVRHMVVVQAQDARAARLGVRARSSGLTSDDVERERLEDRSFVRTWLFRGTIHLVAAEDHGWMRELVAPLLIPQAWRRMSQEGLSRDRAERAAPIVARALRDGPMTRDELREALARKGIRPRGRQALVHLLWLMTYRGEVVTGPYAGSKETMVPARDWLPKSPRAPRDPVAELALRYLIAHGPATLEDFRTWTGLRVGAARAGWSAIGDELEETTVEGASMWRHRDTPTRMARKGLVRLLPAFDAMFLGYRDRSFIGEPDSPLTRGGLFDPFVLADGRAVAGWKLRRARDTSEVDLQPFGRLAAAVRPGLDREVADVVRFLRAGA